MELAHSRMSVQVFFRDPLPHPKDEHARGAGGPRGADPSQWRCGECSLPGKGVLFRVGGSLSGWEKLLVTLNWNKGVRK